MSLLRQPHSWTSQCRSSLLSYLKGPGSSYTFWHVCLGSASSGLGVLFWERSGDRWVEAWLKQSRYYLLLKLGAKRTDKHKNPTFWLSCPRAGRFQTPRFVGSFWSQVVSGVPGSDDRTRTLCLAPGRVH